MRALAACRGLGRGLTAQGLGCRARAHRVRRMTTSSSAATATTDTAKAGRGLLSITGGKIAFILAGYSVQLLLPRLLGSPEAFGLYSSAMSMVSILNNVLIVATLQTMSKRVSEDPALADARLREGLQLQLVVGLVVGGGMLLLAPALANLLLDPLLAPLLRVTSVVVFSYAVYAALIGYLNGREQFHRQALFDLSYTTLRTLGILGAAALGFGALGAVTGFAGAAVVVASIAALVLGVGRPVAATDAIGLRARLRPWLRLMAPLWLYQMCLNLSLQVDLTVLKRSVAALGIEAGMAAEAAAATASRYAGFYRAAQTFSFVPYQLILSVALVVFPMVSRAQSLGDQAATRGYIRGALRFSLIVLLAVAAPVAGSADGVMRIAYPEPYLAGAEALSVLSLGMAAFALFVIAATIMSGAGRPGLSAGVALLSVLFVVSCNVTFVGRAGLGEHTLLAAASGTSVGTTVALLCMGTLVHRRFGAFVPPVSALRILAAAAVGFYAARSVPHSDRMTALVALVAGGLAYLAALFALGELRRKELDAVLAVVQKRRR